MNGLFLRAIFAFLVLPGTIGFLLPWLLVERDRWSSEFNLWCLPVLGAGMVLLFWCVRDFYVAGKGTLAPWSPPKRLVIVGLYRYSRNPMYVGVVLILWGWTIGFRSISLTVYAFVVMVAFHLRVIFFEEPWLRGHFGEDYAAYTNKVPRWFGPRHYPLQTASK